MVHYLRFVTAMALSTCVSNSVYSATVSSPWVGTANYQAAPGAGGDEGVAVGPFSNYDFSSGGALLLKPNNVTSAGAFTVGDTYNAYYQSYVTQHVDKFGNTINSAALNTSGSRGAGTGYELTVAGWFSQQITAVAGGIPIFSIIDGAARVFFDTTPDYNFSADTGFANGANILTGNVQSGSGYLVPFTAGADNVTLHVGGANYDPNVYDPDTISSAAADITLRLNPFGVTSGITSVAGNVYNPATDTLMQADGNLDLFAVPVPAAFWLLVSSLVSGWMFVRRKKD